MIIGICTVELRLGGAQSLKDKRRVIKSAVDQVRGRYNVAVAEVDHQDRWQRATLGIATISNETAQVDRVLAAVMEHLMKMDGLEVLEYSTEIL
ncbi:hypothetical protein SY88_17690 [Clostridiales bacterium PH28_bin88]|nr:hypothetical protein SY88_17690 [Clostridiales bacterium PH28_bin88]